MVKITDEMVELANDVWHEAEGGWTNWWRAALTAVAPLIAAQEREACAKVADAAEAGIAKPRSYENAHYCMAAEHIAAAIRARSETP